MLEAHKLRTAPVAPADLWRRAQPTELDAQGEADSGGDGPGNQVPPLFVLALQSLCARDNVSGFVATMDDVRSGVVALPSAAVLQKVIAAYRGVNTLWCGAPCMGAVVVQRDFSVSALYVRLWVCFPFHRFSTRAPLFSCCCWTVPSITGCRC